MISSFPQTPPLPLALGKLSFEFLALENLMEVRDPFSRKVHIPSNFVPNIGRLVDTQTPAHPVEVQAEPCATE